MDNDINERSVPASKEEEKRAIENAFRKTIKEANVSLLDTVYLSHQAFSHLMLLITKEDIYLDFDKLHEEGKIDKDGLEVISWMMHISNRLSQNLSEIGVS